MKERRKNKMLIEPAAAATGDIAFNLIIFFLVCASVQPDSGRSQTIPKADEQKQQQEKKDDVTVEITRTTVLLNGEVIRQDEFDTRLKQKLAGKEKPEDRIVVVKSADDTPYHHWITVTTMIEDAGGIVTLQIEEEREINITQ